MSSTARDQYPMSLTIERGAARIRVTDSGSPSRVSHREPRLPQHRMTLRSHARTGLPPSTPSVGDISRPQPSFVAESEALENESEATTEIANTREIPCSASEPSRPTSPEEDTEHPFLSLPPSHSRNESRIWEFHGLNESDFVIWEDPDRDSPLILTPLAYSDFEEDKENTYATVSDYDSPDEEEPDVHRIDWARVRAGPHDVFGLPVNTPFGPALPDIPGSGIFNPNLVPTVADTSVRPAVRAIFQDEEESEGEWDDSLSTAQIRELQELNDIYSRAAEHRRHHDRHFPMRDMNVQGQTNIFLEARRITGFQRHEARRHSRGVDEED